MKKKIKAYYDIEVLPFGQKTDITVVEKSFFDKNHALDDGEAPNAEKIEAALIACGFSLLPIAENLYESDNENAFNRKEFEAVAADNGVIMIYNAKIGQFDEED